MSQVYKTGSTFTASPSTLQRSTAPKKQDLKIVIIIPHKKHQFIPMKTAMIQKTNSEW